MRIEYLNQQIKQSIDLKEQDVKDYQGQNDEVSLSDRSISNEYYKVG